MDKFNNWIKSKAGRNTVLGVLVALLLIAVISQLIGGDITGLSGTAGLTGTEYPAPTGGYTCLPTCTENDGKFLLISNLDMDTFAGAKIVVWIAVPNQYTSFELGIFDGDSGLDSNGAINWLGGNWDDGTTETTYTLYADPLKDGSSTLAVGSWGGNQVPMPNNKWYTITLDTQAEAQAPSLHYFYRLEVTQPLVGTGGNAFKLRSNGYLSAGRELLVDSDFALVGQLTNFNDLKIIYPNYPSSGLSGSTYTGDWQFYFYVPNDLQALDFWDGDLDRGNNSVLTYADSDDPNIDGKPDWAGPFTVDEGIGGIGGKGSPPDDNSSILYRRSPAISYELVDPLGSPLYTNNNPSGTEEWEKFTMSTESGDNPDLQVNEIKEGFYMVHIKGLDLHNLVFFRTNFEICDKEDGCGPREWPEGNCPRTIGYWKTNVQKIYIQNKTTGVQESKASLDWALRNIAFASPIYRAGINIDAPVPIADPVPLTPQEAYDILWKTNGNSMLDRALQQNLATWLNMATGKVGPTTSVVIDVPSGTYEGTMEGALLEAENIILYGGNLERAKDIADLINNGQINVDPAETLACTAYAAVIPPDKQPPAYGKMPKAPKQNEPPAPTCSAGNTYTVENTTDEPFYSVKFNYASGTEVKGGASETFQYTLPVEVVEAMTSMQVEVKAGEDSHTYDLICDFTGVTACGQVSDELYGVSLVSALANEDGTYTLVFSVEVYGEHGLSHASFSLPEGQTAGGLTETYQTEVCTTP